MLHDLNCLPKHASCVHRHDAAHNECNGTRDGRVMSENDGKVFAPCSWGWNGDGQLGLGDTSNRSQPELVEDLGTPDSSVTKVTALQAVAVEAMQGSMFPGLV